MGLKETFEKFNLMDFLTKLWDDHRPKWDWMPDWLDGIFEQVKGWAGSIKGIFGSEDEAAADSSAEKTPAQGNLSAAETSVLAEIDSLTADFNGNAVLQGQLGSLKISLTTKFMEAGFDLDEKTIQNAKANAKNIQLNGSDIESLTPAFSAALSGDYLNNPVKTLEQIVAISVKAEELEKEAAQNVPANTPTSP